MESNPKRIRQALDNEDYDDAATSIMSLPRGIRKELIKDLEPWEINHLCKSNRAFNEYCNRGGLWKDMFIAKYGASEYNQLKTALGPDSNDRWIYFARRVFERSSTYAESRFRYEQQLVTITYATNRGFVISTHIRLISKNLAVYLLRTALELFSNEEFYDVPFNLSGDIVLTRGVSSFKVTQFIYKLFAVGFLQDEVRFSDTGYQRYTLRAPVCVNCANEASLTDHAKTFCSKECQVKHYEK